MSQANRWDQLVEAVVAVTSDLDLDALLTRIVDQAREVTGARYAALGVLANGPEGGLASFVHSGLADAAAEAIAHPPHGEGVLGWLVSHPEPLRLDEVEAHPAAVGFPAGHPVMHAFLGVPVRAAGQVFGNLYLADKAGGFDADDEDVVVGLAAVAGAAVTNARLYAELRRTRAELAAAAVEKDRDRIARDLHDLVIGRLFAAGLAVDRVAGHVPEPWASRAGDAVADIDRAIVDLRGSIFALSSSAPDASRLGRMVGSTAGLLGFTPRLEVVGDLTRLGTADRAAVHAVISEALANVGRHAAATVATVEVTVGDDLRITVTDDGRGLPANRTESGLANLRARAEAAGGSLELVTPTGGGTRLVWRAPLTRAEEA